MPAMLLRILKAMVEFLLEFAVVKYPYLYRTGLLRTQPRAKPRGPNRNPTDLCSLSGGRETDIRAKTNNSARRNVTDSRSRDELFVPLPPSLPEEGANRGAEPFLPAPPFLLPLPAV